METVAHIKYGNGKPANLDFAVAETGFKRLGIKTEPMDDVDQLDGLGPEHMAVAGINDVRERLWKLGVTPECLNYPDELLVYMGRPVHRTTLDKLLYFSEDAFPLFAKAEREKMFDAGILYSPLDNSINPTSECRVDEPVFYSPVMNIASEWRAFVLDGMVKDIRPYGNHIYGWRHPYDPGVVESMVSAYKRAPAAYVLDVGVALTDSGYRTILIEVNDGYSFGSYGLDATVYAKMLEKRWLELTGQILSWYKKG